ncbi:MAG: hypothetical protein HY350_04140 [Candidatus Omnitrophica bacterium]|nr:hypothetical protein [Candidatus Omnitrophota bacterium]
MRRWSLVLYLTGCFFILLTRGFTAEVPKQVLPAASDEIPKQVMIEAKVVEMTIDASRELGIDWVFLKDATKGTDLGVARGYFPPPSYVPPSTTTTFPPASIVKTGFKGTEFVFEQVKIGTGFLDAKISAMVEKGEAEVLSNPRVVTVENVEAKIVTGDEVPYQSTSVVGNQVTLKTEFKEVGIKLNVTPRVIKDGHVLIKVYPEVSNVSGSQEVVQAGGQTARLPVFSKRSVDTLVVVKDGQTFVLGGLYKTQKEKLRRGVPILSSIPLLGLFFESRRDITKKTELVFFITPVIIKADQQFILPPVSEEPSKDTPVQVLDLTQPSREKETKDTVTNDTSIIPAEVNSEGTKPEEAK